MIESFFESDIVVGDRGTDKCPSCLGNCGGHQKLVPRRTGLYSPLLSTFTMSDKAQPNALGLDFSQPVQAQEEESPASAVQSPTLETPKKKELPYVNPDRVRTGGTQKVDEFLHVLYDAMLS